MKVLIMISSLSVGGAENMIYELTKQIDKKQYEVEILCIQSRYGNNLEEKIEKYAKVYYLEIDGAFCLGNIKKIFTEIREIKPDVIHAHLGSVLYAFFWTLVNKTPLVITVHSRPDKAFEKHINFLLKTIILKNRIRLIAVSEENEKLLKKYYKSYTKSCTYVNNGVDIDIYYRKPHSNYTFINVARQDENKNQIAIIECFYRLQKEFECNLILVGNGPCSKLLKHRVKELNIEDKVLFTGTVGNPNEYYAISDCYVQASHREALPMAILEAIATGLPIVSSNVGGIREVVSNENGILYRDNDNEALYEGMKECYGFGFDQIEKCKIKSRELAQKYSSKQMAKQYEEIYVSMI